MQTVEQLVDPAPSPQPDPERRRNASGTTQEQIKRDKRPLRSRKVLAAGLGALVIVIALVVFVLRPSGSGSISAAQAVAAVSPDRLAGLVLESRFGSKDVPTSMSALNPVLSPVLTPGLLDNVLVPFFGPASYLAVRYLVFDSPGVAGAFYANTNPLPEGYGFTGSFRATSITDPTRCDTGHAEATATGGVTRDSSCAALSANVVSFAEVTSGTNSTATDDNLAVALTQDAIRHLSVVAGAAPTGPVPPPPGSVPPRVLSRRIVSTRLGNILPQGLELLSLRAYHVGSGSPPGLVAGSYVDAALKGDGHRDSVFFYVFGTARQAKAFDTDLAPDGVPHGSSRSPPRVSPSRQAAEPSRVPRPRPRRAITSQAVQSAGVTSSCTARRALPRTPRRTRVPLP